MSITKLLDAFMLSFKIMMVEMCEFFSTILGSFNEMGFPSQCFLGFILLYTAFRITGDLVKLIIMQFFQWGRKRNNPLNPRFNPMKIYLFMFHRSMTKKVPNLSPFVIKVETWLRLRNIPYEPVETRTFSNSTRQLPYINHRGREISDSEFIIQYVENEFNLDPTEGLRDFQVGASRAIIKMVDHSLGVTYFLHRYVFARKKFRMVYNTPYSTNITASLYSYIFSRLFLYKHKLLGMGRKPPDEIYHIGENDIRAISAYLGNKPFLMGNYMTKVDCAVFAHLCQIIYVYPAFRYPHMDIIQTECTNLISYVDRIKTKCWPDWETLTEKGVFHD